MDRTDTVQVPLGGMLEQAITLPDTAFRIENMRYEPDGVWVSVPGVQAVLTTGATARSIHWFNPRPNQRWLILERVLANETNRIGYVDLNDESFVQIVDRRRTPADDQGTVFAEHGRWLYMFSAVDAPVRWNGKRTEPVGYVTRPSSPQVSGPNEGYNVPDVAGATELGAGFTFSNQRGVGPSEEEWRYGYALVQVNWLGQCSERSSTVFASGTNDDSSGLRTVKVRMPRQPDHIAAMILLRTANLVGVDVEASTEATMYPIATFNTGAQVDYTDLASEGETLYPWNDDEVGPIPIGPRAAVFWQGALWLGGAPSDPTRLHYSTPLFPEQFPVINYLVIGSSRTGSIVALYVSPRGLIVFKESGVYLVVGQPGSYRVETIDESIGCAAPRAIEQVRGQGLIFLAPTGPHMLRGTDSEDAAAQVVPVPGIRKTWRERVGRRLQGAVSVYDPEYNEVWFQVPEGGNSDPTFGLVYHAQLNQWSIRPNWNVSCFARHLGKTWMGLWDSGFGRPQVCVLTKGAGVLGTDGEDLTCSYTVSRTEVQRQTYISVEPWIISLGTSPISLGVRVDRMPEEPMTTAGAPQTQGRSTREVWGTAQWDATKTWVDNEPVRIPIGVRMAVAHEFQARLVASRMSLFACDLVVVSKADVKPRPERT